MRRLIIEPVGGLANRLRALLSAEILAERLDARLEIAWDRENPICACRVEALFEGLSGVPLSICREPGVHSLGSVSSGRYGWPSGERVPAVHIRTSETFRPDHLFLQAATAYVVSSVYQMRRRVLKREYERDPRRVYGGHGIVFDDTGDEVPAP